MEKELNEESMALLEKIIDNYLSNLLAEYFSEDKTDKEKILAEYTRVCKLNLDLGLDLPGVTIC